MESLILPFLLVSAVVCAVLADRMAGRKGRNRNTWMFLGLLFGWLAILVLATVPDTAPIPSGMRRVYCPRCNAEQNISQGAPSYECWQCHQTSEVEIKR